MKRLQEQFDDVVSINWISDLVATHSVLRYWREIVFLVAQRNAALCLSRAWKLNN